MKKLEPIEALAKIKVKIRKYYEDIGRETQDYLNPETEPMDLTDLIDVIEEIVDRVKIPAKNLIAERFDEDFKPTDIEDKMESL